MFDKLPTSPLHPIPASHIEPAQNQPLGEPGSDSLSIVVGNDNSSSHQHMDTERQRKRRHTVPTEERKRRKIRSCRRCHDEEVCLGGNDILRCHCISLHVLCLADSEGDLMDVGVSMEGKNALYCRLKLVCVEVEGAKEKRTNSDRCGLLNIIRTTNRRWSPNLAREIFLFLFFFSFWGLRYPVKWTENPCLRSQNVGTPTVHITLGRKIDLLIFFLHVHVPAFSLMTGAILAHRTMIGRLQNPRGGFESSPFNVSKQRTDLPACAH